MITCGDCVTGMRDGVASDSVDLVLADPPYNIKCGAAWDDMSDDTYRTFTTNWLHEAHRILRPGGSLLVWGSPCTVDMSRLTLIAVDECGFDLVQNMAWIFTQGGDGRLKTMRRYATRHETLAWFCKPGGSRTFVPQPTPYTDDQRRIAKMKGSGRLCDESLSRGRPPRSWFDVPRVNSKSNERRYGSHPCMKPLDLCETLIRTHSHEDDTVVVPFAGSGSELVAGTRAGRRMIGFELDETYVALCRTRLDA